MLGLTWMARRYFLFFLNRLYLYSAFLEQVLFTHTHTLISKPKHFLKFTHSQYNGCIRDSPGFSTMSKDTTCRLGEPGIKPQTFQLWDNKLYKWNHSGNRIFTAYCISAYVTCAQQQNKQVLPVFFKWSISNKVAASTTPKTAKYHVFHMHHMLSDMAQCNSWPSLMLSEQTLQ